MDCKNNATELNVQYLSEAIKIIPESNRSFKLLKSHLLTRLNSLAPSLGSQFRSQYQEAHICKRCFSGWSNGASFSMDIAEGSSRNKKLQKIVQSYDTDRNSLTPTKQALAKRYQKLVQDAGVITCNLCNSKMKISFKTINENRQKEKQQLKEAAKAEKTVINIDDIEIVRKKPKKDKFAGLNVNKLSVPAKKSDELLADTVKPPQVQPIEIRLKPKLAVAAPPVKVLKNNNKKLSKSMKSGKKSKAKNVAQDMLKKQNNILLLANVLKMNEAKVDVKNVSSANLQKMLK